MRATAWILWGAVESLLLYCRFDFIWERRSTHSCDESLVSEERKSNIVPLQLGPASIEWWSEGTWDRFLSAVDSSDSTDRRSETAKNRDYDIAA